MAYVKSKYWRCMENFSSGRIKKVTYLAKTKAVVFGYRSFKPSKKSQMQFYIMCTRPNSSGCPIIVVPLPENCVIFSMFSGLLFRFFFQISRIYENVYVKILLLSLFEKFSRTCDFCLMIIADRPVQLFIMFLQTNKRNWKETGILLSDRM